MCCNIVILNISINKWFIYLFYSIFNLNLYTFISKTIYEIVKLYIDCTSYYSMHYLVHILLNKASHHTLENPPIDKGTTCKKKLKNKLFVIFQKKFYEV